MISFSLRIGGRSIVSKLKEQLLFASGDAECVALIREYLRSKPSTADVLSTIAEFQKMSTGVGTKLACIEHLHKAERKRVGPPTMH